MAEAHSSLVEVDDPRLDGRLKEIDVDWRSVDDPACLEHLAHAIVVVERSEQQKQPGLLGQIGDAGGERLLKPVCERHQTRHRRVLFHTSGGDRELDQRQRVAGCLVQDPGVRCRVEVLR